MIFVNPDSGPGADIGKVVETFAGHDVVEAEPIGIADQLRKFLECDASPAFVGVAGGDGTIRAAVEVLLDGFADLPLLAIPIGTRNHFARDVGIETIDDAVAAAEAGRT